MKKTVYTKAGQVGLVEVERPHIEAPDDVILRIVRTCVCGSDLWSYRNPDIEEGRQNSGHEALGVLHNGGRLGFVGVPHYKNRALGSTFAQNISVAGGAASVTTYDKQFLLKAVLDGDINPGRVFTHSYRLDEIDQAYKDMDERKTIKAMIVIE